MLPNCPVYKPAVRNGAAPTTRGVLWLVLLAVCLSCLAWWPLLLAYPLTQADGGQYFHRMLEAARVGVQRYHELPLWNPFDCGGVPLWDNPQGLAAAPLAWLVLVVDTTRAIDLWLVLHTAAGLLCMWALARVELGLSRPASVVAAASWAFAGVHGRHLNDGDLTWVVCLYFPLVLLLWRRAEHDLRAAVGAGLVVALTVLEGGTYWLPQLGLLLAAETVFRLWSMKSLVPIARAAAVVVLVAVGVGAARLFPVMDQLVRHLHDPVADPGAVAWTSLHDVFLVRDHAPAGSVVPRPPVDFGDYVGPLVLGLAALGLLALKASELWVLGLFVASFALMLSRFAPYGPSSVVDATLFPFRQLRVPTRFVATVTLFLSVFAGVAVDRWPRRLRFARVSRELAVLSVFVALGLIGVGDELSLWITWAARTAIAPAEDRAVATVYRMRYGPPHATGFLDTPRSNVADLTCREDWGVTRDAPLWMGDVPQARSMMSGLRVVLADRTSSSFTVDVEGTTPGRVLLNSAYDLGWRSDVGNVVAFNKLLAVELPPGTYRVHLRYWPRALTMGLVLSGLSTILVGAWLVRGLVRTRRRQRATVAA